MTSLIVLQGCMTIQLSRGKTTLVDLDDAGNLGPTKWYAQPTPRGEWYCVRNVQVSGSGKNRRQRREYLHRILMGNPNGLHVDHKDGDGLNNTRENLRIVTNLQNNMNQRRTHGKSKFKGVSWCSRTRKWRSTIRAEGRQINLGFFETEIKAANSYDQGAKKYFGEFAATNEMIFGQETHEMHSST